MKKFKYEYNKHLNRYLILDKMGLPLGFYAYISLLVSMTWGEIYNFFHDNYSGELAANSITIVFKTEIDVIKAIEGLESLIIMDKLMEE